MIYDKVLSISNVATILNQSVEDVQCMHLCCAPELETQARAGVLLYFAGAEVCSPPPKLRQHLFVLQTSIIDQRKN